MQAVVGECRPEISRAKFWSVFGVGLDAGMTAFFAQSNLKYALVGTPTETIAIRRTCVILRGQIEIRSARCRTIELEFVSNSESVR